MNEKTIDKIQQWITDRKVREVSVEKESVKDVVKEEKVNTVVKEKVATVKQDIVKSVPVKSDVVETDSIEKMEDISEWKNKIFHGNCLEILRRMPSGFVSAVVTDPPYGLSKQPDMTEVLRRWLDGDDYEHSSSGFMGKSWDSFVPGPKIWKEIMRVLKPGGHILSFSGTRTYDMAVLAMRMAGSEVRDKIDYVCEQQEPLDWIHGQGFPKSLNIGKAMEKSAGVEREIVGKMDVGPDMRGGNFKASEGRKVSDITVPATEDGKKWDGYGTALKPAHEPIAVFGKESEPLTPEVPFKYESKASTKERNFGCENMYWLMSDEGAKLITKEEYDSFQALPHSLSEDCPPDVLEEIKKVLNLTN